MRQNGLKPHKDSCNMFSGYLYGYDKHRTCFTVCFILVYKKLILVNVYSFVCDKRDFHKHAWPFQNHSIIYGCMEFSRQSYNLVREMECSKT